ncbi:hypothetical protein EON62_00595 [archaeon]|nr:MAG: hypothetical protein EON62_00595 [archaeon]
MTYVLRKHTRGWARRVRQARSLPCRASSHSSRPAATAHCCMQVTTYRDVFDWLESVFYKGVYGQDSPFLDGIVNYTLTEPDPNATLPVIQNVYQVVGGARLRQIRVSRDSCEEHGYSGRYYLPAQLFNASKLTQTGVGALGEVGVWNRSVSEFASAGEGLPAYDGGTSASSRLKYPFGCMNYWSLTGQCPNSKALDLLTNVLVNTNPGADISASPSPVQSVPVSVQGLLKCSMHNVTVERAQQVYNAFNPVASRSFDTAVEADASTPGYVRACLGRFDTLQGNCFPDYDNAREQMAPLVGNAGRTFFFTSRAADDNLVGVYGFAPANGYGSGGYLVNLTNDPLYAAAQLAQLRDNGWIDRGTRAIVADFNVWNGNSRIATAVRIVFEMYSTGYMKSFTRFLSFRITRLDGPLAIQLYVAMGGFVIAWLYFFFKEVQRVKFSYQYSTYLRSVRNVYVVRDNTLPSAHHCARRRYHSAHVTCAHTFAHLAPCAGATAQHRRGVHWLLAALHVLAARLRPRA